MSIKLQLPPIENEVIFSDFVLDLFNLENNTTSFQYFGKKGNKQNGVDIISVPQAVAIQCKKKELIRRNLVNELKADFEKTIQKIAQLKIEFKQLVFVSTFHDSAELIDYLSQLMQKHGLPFHATYRGWQSLQNSAQNYTELLKKYFPSIYVGPKILTPIPFFDTNLLLGREYSLEMVKKFNTQYAAFVLQGIGGIGKTVLISSYIDQNNQKFNNIIWIGNHLNSIESNVLTQLSSSIGSTGKSGPEAWRFCLNELRNTHGNNLFVLDGVNEVNDHVIKCIEELCSTGWKVIITARSKISDLPTMDLGALPPEAARKLFLHYFNRQTNDNVLNKILEKVDYHPLLVELLAKAANSNPTLILEQLHQLISEDKLKDPAIQNMIAIGRHASKADARKHERIFKYLLFCFRIFDLNPAEKRQLLYFSVLPQTSDFSIDWYLDITEQAQKHEKPVEEAVNILSNKGWISIRRGIFYIHPLIQIVTREHLKITVNKILPVIMRCTFHLKNIQNSQAYSFSNYISTARNILNAISVNVETIFLTQFYAKALTRTGDYLTAIRYLEECLEYCRQKGIDAPEFISSFLNNLGTAYFDIGRYDEAATYLTRAVEIAKMADIDTSVSIGTSLDNLASTFEKLGRYEEAVQLTKHAIKIFEDNDAPEELGLAYINLANTYCCLENYGQALKFSKRAYRLLKEFHEKNSLRFAEYYNTMGLIYLGLQKAGKANGCYRKVKCIFELDNNPEDLSMAYSNIATTELMLNQPEDAKQNLDKAIALQNSLGQINRHSYGDILQNLADYYVQTGQAHQASKILREMKQVFSEILPEDHDKLQNIKGQMKRLKQGLPDPEQYKLRNTLFILREQIDDYIKHSKGVIDKFGEVKVIKYNSQSDETYLHDYMFFCFARSCKTISSIVVLLKKERPEDAMTLLYAVYRNYLMMTFLSRNPKSAYTFIFKSLMLSQGKYRFVEKGNILEPSLFRHPDSDKELSVFPELSSLIQNTVYADDIIVHRYIGTFLNEAASSDFLTSGNYRAKDQLHYSYSEKNPNLQSEMLTLYLLLLSYGEIVTFINDQKEIQFASKAFKKDLYALYDTINQVTHKDDSIKQAMLKRLKKLGEITRRPSASR